MILVVPPPSPTFDVGNLAKGTDLERIELLYAKDIVKLGWMAISYSWLLLMCMGVSGAAVDSLLA